MDKLIDDLFILRLIRVGDGWLLNICLNCISFPYAGSKWIIWRSGSRTFP